MLQGASLQSQHHSNYRRQQPVSSPQVRARLSAARCRTLFTFHPIFLFNPIPILSECVVVVVLPCLRPLLAPSVDVRPSHDARHSLQFSSHRYGLRYSVRNHQSLTDSFLLQLQALNVNYEPRNFAPAAPTRMDGSGMAFQRTVSFF